MFSSAPRPRSSADRDSFIGISQSLRFHAQRTYDGYRSGVKRLLHDQDLMEEIETIAGTDLAQRSARLETLFAETTGRDYDFTALREASALERRQALGAFAETFAVFEDIREGTHGKRRHAKEFVAIPLELPALPRTPTVFPAYRPPEAPPQLPESSTCDVALVQATTPIPPNHIRILRETLTGNKRRFDVLVNVDTMTVQEAINLINPGVEMPPNFRLILFYDGARINSKGGLLLRAAGIALQTEIRVIALFNQSPHHDNRSNTVSTLQSFATRPPFETRIQSTSSAQNAASTAERIHRAIAQSDGPEDLELRVEALARTYFEHSQEAVETAFGTLLQRLRGHAEHAPSFAALRDFADVAPQEVEEELGVYYPVFAVARDAEIPAPSQRPASPPALDSFRMQTRGASPVGNSGASAHVSHQTALMAHSSQQIGHSPQVHARPSAGQALQPPTYALAHASPAGLTQAILATDGHFYERSLVGATEIVEAGLVDCAAYAEFTEGQWRRLAATIGQLRTLCDKHLLASTCAAWLRVSNSFERGPSRDFCDAIRLLCADEIRRHVQDDVVFRNAVVSSLHPLPSGRWRHYIQQMLKVGEPLTALGDGAVDAALMLAHWHIDNKEGRPKGPSDNFVLPPALLVQVAHVLGENSLVVEEPGLVFSAIEALYTLHPYDQPSACLPRLGSFGEIHGARRLAMSLCAVEPRRLEGLVKTIQMLTGSSLPLGKATATLADCATLAQALTTTPWPLPFLLQGIEDAPFIEAGRGGEIWLLTAGLDRLSDLPEGSEAHQDVCRALRALTGHYQLNYPAMLKLISTCSNYSWQNFAGADELCRAFLAAENAFTAAQILACFAAFLVYPPNIQALLLRDQAILERRLSTEPGLKIRQLSNPDFLFGFLTRQASAAQEGQRPVIMRAAHRPHVDVETVMSTDRMASMRADMATVLALTSHNRRMPFSTLKPAISTFLASSEVDPLRSQWRRGTSRLANATYALEHLGKLHDLKMTKLCAGIWQAIQGYKNSRGEEATHIDQRAMRYSLACALADCIESEGNMVCIWGQGQYMLGALHGYGFSLRAEAQVVRQTPAELLTALGMAFAQSLAALEVEEPHTHDVEKFCREAMARATEVLSPQELAPFRARLIEYLEQSEWAVPNF